MHCDLNQAPSLDEVRFRSFHEYIKPNFLIEYTYAFIRKSYNANNNSNNNNNNNSECNNSLSDKAYQLTADLISNYPQK